MDIGTRPAPIVRRLQQIFGQANALADIRQPVACFRQVLRWKVARYSLTSMYSRAQMRYSSGCVYLFDSADAERSVASIWRCSRRQS